MFIYILHVLAKVKTVSIFVAEKINERKKAKKELDI